MRKQKNQLCIQKTFVHDELCMKHKNILRASSAKCPVNTTVARGPGLTLTLRTCTLSSI